MTMKAETAWGGKALSRRDFLRLGALSATGILAGCAVNPVSGRRQLMMVSEADEIQIDKQNSPHQFSSDYGFVQDPVLEAYVGRMGKQIAARTHRSHMPYAFHAVNATYANAYAFPGGSIACTRGILVSLENEAELTGLLGHELGHVNARHTAEQMSKGMLTQVIVGGLSALAGSAGSGYGQLASQLGMMGAGALLASYSRDNEREADALGMEYMVRSGYSPSGMIGLMDVLRSMSKHTPSAIELMFSTHPMSEERYQTAVSNSRGPYGKAASLPLNRERYMDNTAGLRALKGAIEELQKGERDTMNQRYPDAESHYTRALKFAPRDYAALMMMAACQLVQKKNQEGLRYAKRAREVYPGEAGAYHLSGFARIRTGAFDAAYRDFSRYDRLLPGNPTITFYKGYAQENMQHREEAAREYGRYLQVVQQGDRAQYAYGRLKEWGYVK